MISSFARLKTVILFSGFFQLICFASSFVKGPLGGTCSVEENGVLIPYLFDIMYGLQVFVMMVFIIERFCGFGREPKEVKDPEEEKKDEEDKSKEKN